MVATEEGRLEKAMGMACGAMGVGVLEGAVRAAAAGGPAGWPAVRLLLLLVLLLRRWRRSGAAPLGTKVWGGMRAGRSVAPPHPVAVPQASLAKGEVAAVGLGVGLLAKGVPLAVEPQG